MHAVGGFSGKRTGFGKAERRFAFLPDAPVLHDFYFILQQQSAVTRFGSELPFLQSGAFHAGAVIGFAEPIEYEVFGRKIRQGFFKLNDGVVKRAAVPRLNAAAEFLLGVSPVGGSRT